MLAQKFSVIILVTAVLTEPMCQSSLAFNIKGQTNSSSVSIQVSIPSNNINGNLNVTTKAIKELERGGTNDFLNILGQSYGNNWQFKKGANLKGGFNVTTYYPCHPLTPCGIDLAAKYPGVRVSIPLGGSKDGVGTSFSVDYERNRQDEPNPSLINDTFWIQRATVNTGAQPITYGGQTNTHFDLIDAANPTYPFYPLGGLLGRINPQTGELLSSLIDVPYNFKQSPQPGYLYNNDWTFELYLAKFMGTKKVNKNKTVGVVKIYNGISWGWTSTFTPCVPSSGGGGCRSTSSLNTATQEQEMTLSQSANFANNDENVDLAGISSELLLDPELSPQDSNNPNAINSQNASTDDSDDALAAEDVPEPTTALGALLALCGLGTLKKLKNRKIKQQ